MSEEMRKGFGFDARAKGFDLDPDHAALLDATRQTREAGTQEDRAHAGDGVGAGQSEGEAPEQAASA